LTMTRELLDAFYIYYMETKGYTYSDYDLAANWKYWCKEPENGSFSWLGYLLVKENRVWKFPYDGGVLGFDRGR